MPRVVKKLSPPDTDGTLRVVETPALNLPDQVPERGEFVVSAENLQPYVPERKGRKGSDPTKRPGYRLGELIRTLIHSKGFSRLEVAKKVGISASGINQLVAGYTKYPDAKTVRGLADVLGVSPLTLLAHTPLITEKDIRRFLVDEMAEKRLGVDDATWNVIGHQLADLSPEQRVHVVKVLQAVLASMGVNN